MSVSSSPQFAGQHRWLYPFSTTRCAAHCRPSLRSDGSAGAPLVWVFLVSAETERHLLVPVQVTHGEFGRAGLPLGRSPGKIPQGISRHGSPNGVHHRAAVLPSSPAAVVLRKQDVRPLLAALVRADGPRPLGIPSQFEPSMPIDAATLQEVTILKIGPESQVVGRSRHRCRSSSRKPGVAHGAGGGDRRPGTGACSFLPGPVVDTPCRSFIEDGLVCCRLPLRCARHQMP